MLASELEKEVSKMATNLLDLQRRSGRIRKKIADQSLVWTDGALGMMTGLERYRCIDCDDVTPVSALSLRRLRREKNVAEEYVMKNSSSSRALLAATRDSADKVDRSKTVVIQKGKLRLMFVADNKQKKNRDHRKFQSGRNHKIESKILNFVHT